MTVAKVRDFWNVDACGSHFVDEWKDDREFFAKYREFRYTTEWHIPELVPFAESAGKSVLEIGCGNGADGVQFARHGASYTGVDLTPTAVEKSRRHFRCLGLPGTFQTENAESLSFADESFDTVYSHGVLHHTSRPEQAFAEVFRVLKPGGRAILMLYHRRSFNYYARIMGYMRLRVLGRVLARTGRWKRDRAALSKDLIGLQDGTDGRVWDLHYRNFLDKGWGYLGPREFVHHCTDGPECPYAFCYSKADLRRRLGRFARLRFKVAHFPLKKSRLLRWVPRGVERSLARAMGWYLFVYADK